jgi:hypothetical protein
MAAARNHHRDPGRPGRRQPALLVLAALLATALTGCTLGRQPQARSAPAPVIAPSAQAATGDIPQGLGIVRVCRDCWVAGVQLRLSVTAATATRAES